MAKMYAVALDGPDAAVGNALGRSTTRSRVLTHVLSCRRRSKTSVRGRRRRAVIKSDPRPANGVVFRLNGSYSGYTEGNAVGWLHDAGEG